MSEKRPMKVKRPYNKKVVLEQTEQTEQTETINIAGVDSTTITGLGDAVKAVTNFLGIETCDDCEKRRQKMNDMYSFLRSVRREMTPVEIEIVEQADRTKVILDSRWMTNLMNDVYGTKYQVCNCPGLYKDILAKLIIAIEKQKIK